MWIPVAHKFSSLLPSDPPHPSLTAHFRHANSHRLATHLRRGRDLSSRTNSLFLMEKEILLGRMFTTRQIALCTCTVCTRWSLPLYPSFYSSCKIPPLIPVLKSSHIPEILKLLWVKWPPLRGQGWKRPHFYRLSPDLPPYMRLWHPSDEIHLLAQWEEQFLLCALPRSPLGKKGKDRWLSL